MMTIREPEREIQVLGAHDVIVAGGGTAGVMAAIAAARNGASTLILERSGFFGGNIATQLLEHSAGWQDAAGHPIVGGLPLEMIDRLKAGGASPGLVDDDTGYTRTRLPVEHELFKSLIVEWLDEEGVAIMPQAPVVAVSGAGVASGTEAALHAICETRSGRIAFCAKAMVDATGDADLFAKARCDFHPTSATQPVSMMFKLGNVDHAAALAYVRANPGDFKMDAGQPGFEGRHYYNLWGYGALLRRGFEAGIVSLDRKEMHVACHVLTREAVINVTRYAADATDAGDMARAELVLRRQVREFVRFFRKMVPGYESTFLSATASCVGVRESRRIKGRATLTDDDVRSGRDFADAVARGGFPIDSHDAKGNSMDGTEPVPSGYDIPLGAMLPVNGPNLIAAGRCISAERRALASARITGTCMAMGQAAGTAAALSALSGIPMVDLDIAQLQQRLREQGALFGGKTREPAI
ncbi:FAD-dependent oxidoreductase [Pseudochelatococcus lubricantis]|uniref:FAD-dependent oxidoreductase n=1 Tax=Pseudochelatococcus lubricantis TaxID=1538102 RepID=UPI0035E5426D